MTVWLKLDEASDYVKISKDLLRAAIRNGDLPAFGVGTGRDFRLKATDLDAWMEARPYEPSRSA